MNGGLTIKLRTINDSLWIGSGLYFNGNFSFFKKGVRGKEIIPYFVDDPRLSNAERMMREANTFRLTPDKSLLIRSSLDAGLIEVYANQSQQIHEYDLEGNLLNVLILDTPICAMDISPDGKTMYALDAEGERKLIAFDLTKE